MGLEAAAVRGTEKKIKYVCVPSGAVPGHILRHSPSAPGEDVGDPGQGPHAATSTCGDTDGPRGPGAERAGARPQSYGHAPWMRRLRPSKKVRVP